MRGSAYDLLLALCGRRVALESLDGPGRDLPAVRIGRQTGVIDALAAH